MKTLTAILLTLTCIPLGASDVRFPTRTVSVPSEPVQEIRIEVVTTLPIGELYIVESDSELIIRQFPEGLLTVREITPGGIRPMGIDGLFAGGDREGETRVFSAAHIYSFRGVKPGRVQVDVIPKGTLIQTEADAPLLVLTVSGSGPQPPPKPDPEPEPQPEPVAQHVSLAIVEDTMNRSPDTAILMNRLVAWTEFVDSGNDWRAYDLKTGEPRGKHAITDLNGPVPGIVLYDKSTGAMVHRGNMPATFEELQALIARIRGR